MTDTWDPKQYDKFQRAFQVPAQHDTPTHTIAEELTAVEPFKSAFGGWRRSHPVLTPNAYARVLYRYGFGDPKVQLIVYPHVLASGEDVVEWMKRTRLRRRPFFYPFKRILCWGQRA